MRITREALLKLAHEAAVQRARVNREITCIYLTGSLLSEAPLLGGTTDIDLICIHASEPAVPREIVRLTEDIHLDVAHYSQNLFRQPRHLRLDSWLGAYLVENPQQLHDTQHWFEFTQAGVSAQFYDPETVIQRVRPAAEAARQAWVDLQETDSYSAVEWTSRYLWILEKAANAIACLNGAPLTERRFILQYPQRAEAVGRPGLASGLVDLYVPEVPAAEAWQGWLVDWKQAFSAASKQPDAPLRIAAPRRQYYERAMTALWDDQPTAALWLLLRTWTLVVKTLADDQATLPWQAAMQTLALDPSQYSTRLTELDSYLDGVEETVDGWAAQNGVV